VIWSSACGEQALDSPIKTGRRESRDAESGPISEKEYVPKMLEHAWKRGRLVAVGVIAIVAIGALAAACGSDNKSSKTPTSAPSAAAAGKATPAAGATAAATKAAVKELGTTPGWGGGSVATVFYTKEFFCDKTPCEAGAAGANAPGTKDPIPSVWVLVPLFADKSGINFHCPDAGNCVAHPKELDVSKIGLGSVIPLPPHSHIVDTKEAGFSGAADTPWKVVVVGVKTRAAWDMLEQGKSIDALRSVQASDANATKDLPSDIVLFFGIR